MNKSTAGRVHEVIEILDTGFLCDCPSTKIRIELEGENVNTYGQIYMLKTIINHEGVCDGIKKARELLEF